jgi:EmrB/QacA subfamily drug resistance transporter
VNASSATRQQRWIVVSLALAGFIATLDDYIVAVSLPSIAADFNATTSEASWVTVAYLLTLVSSLLLFGRLGDRFGHRRVFLSGYATFVLGSALCALAPSLPALIGFRVLQGLGAAMLSVTAPALIAEYVGASRRGWAFGVFTTVTTLGITLGAPLGGIITGLLSWHAVFAVNVPVGIVAAVAAARVLPRDAPSRRGSAEVSGYDVPGVVLSGTGLVLLVLGLNQGEELGGWTAPPVVALFVGAVVLLSAFVWWELRATSPLADLRALRDPVLRSGLIAALAGYMLLAGCNFLLPFYLIYVVGLRPEQVGLVMIAYSAVYVAASPIAGRWSDTVGQRRVSGAGMAVAAAASAYMVWVAGWQSGLVLVVLYLVWRAVAYALFIAPNNALVMSTAKAERRGSTSGLLKVAVNLSLVLGLVMFETLFSLPVAEGAGSLSTMLANGQVDSATMRSGMVIAYSFGVLMSITAVAATVTARRRRAGQSAAA